MKRFLYICAILFFILTILFANPYTALADGGGGHGVEAEVNGFHVTLASQNDWAKGENTIVVTIADGMEMPVSNADVEILVTPKAAGHAVEQPQESMPGMDTPATEAPAMPGMDTNTSATAVPGTMTRVGKTASPNAMLESEPGTYTFNTHLNAAGEQDVQVLFHANGEMLQADFVVEVVGTNSRNSVLWGFVMVNMVLVASAGIMKRKSIPVKGGK
jgi:hypothetical protein